MSDQTYSVARLAKDLPGMGLTVTSERDGLRLGAEGTDPHVMMRVDDEGLLAYLHRGMEAGEAVFPDVPPLVGAYRLLLGNLEEYVSAWGTGLLSLDLRPDELVVQRKPFDPRDLGLPADFDPDGNYTWVAEPPSR